MSTNVVEIYTRQGCRYSENARSYLSARGIEFKEIDAGASPGRDEMIERAGGKTSTPQIFLDGELIGGYDDMVQSGTLERFRQT